MPTRQERGRASAALAFGLALALAGPATAAVPDASEVDRLKQQLDATRQELAKTRAQLESTQGQVDALSQRFDSLQAEARSAPAAESQAPAGATARIAPVNADNPAVSFVIDTELATDTHSSWESIGYPHGWNYSLKNGELFISAPIDPYLRGYASINGTSDGSFDIEEAALVTTSLPWGLTVKGGRFFADFGRFPHWHDEALPFVDRPPSIERLIGGESTAEGTEVSLLTPLDTYLVLTGGIYNTVGAESLDTLNDEGFFGRRSFDELTFLGRAHTYLDLTDTLNVELGGSWLGVPHDSDRNLWGVDVTLRHQPGTTTAYQGFDWGTEWMWNRGRFTERDANGAVVDRTRMNRQGGYSYVEAFFARQYSAGARFDYSEAIDGPEDRAKTASVFVTWRPSEFQRLRFQFDNTWGAEDTNQRFTVQWTAFIGSHSHGFAQR
jgi:uncharacterized coiled-coil protein SlyX